MPRRRPYAVSCLILLPPSACGPNSRRRRSPPSRTTAKTPFAALPFRFPIDSCRSFQSPSPSPRSGEQGSDEPLHHLSKSRRPVSCSTRHLLQAPAAAARARRAQFQSSLWSCSRRPSVR